MSKQNQPNSEAGHDYRSSPKLRKRLEKLNEPLMELAQRQQNIIDFANRMATASVVPPTAVQRIADTLISNQNIGTNPNIVLKKPSPSLNVHNVIPSEHKAQQLAIEAQAKANADAFKNVINDVLKSHSQQTEDFEEKLAIKTVLLTVILTTIFTIVLPELFEDWRINYFEKQAVEQSIGIRDIPQYEDY